MTCKKVKDLFDVSEEVEKHSVQSYKASTIAIYESRVINMINLLVITTVES